MICPHCHRETDTREELADQRWLAKLTEVVELIHEVVTEGDRKERRAKAEENRQRQKERSNAKRNTSMDP